MAGVKRSLQIGRSGRAPVETGTCTELAIIVVGRVARISSQRHKGSNFTEYQKWFPCPTQSLPSKLIGMTTPGCNELADYQWLKEGEASAKRRVQKR